MPLFYPISSRPTHRSYTQQPGLELTVSEAGAMVQGISDTPVNLGSSQSEMGDVASTRIIYRICLG